MNTIVNAFPQSLDLGIRAAVSAIVFGLFFGIVAALYRGKIAGLFHCDSRVDRHFSAEFCGGRIVAVFFGVYLKVLPVARYESFRHTLMPAFALRPGTHGHSGALHARQYAEVVNADYIKTAKAKGCEEISDCDPPPDPQRPVSDFDSDYRAGDCDGIDRFVYYRIHLRHSRSGGGTTCWRCKAWNR